MSKIGFGIIAVVILAALLPFAFIARMRASKSTGTAFTVVLDMDDQPKKKTQSPSIMFADGRAMRPQLEGTVAREDMMVAAEVLNDSENPRIVGEDIHLADQPLYSAVMLGRVRSAEMTDEAFNAMKPPADDAAVAADKTFYVRTIPPQIKVTRDFVLRGQERFNIYCAPCHGQAGYGDGPVALRASSLQNSGVADGAPGWTTPQDLHDPKIHARPDGHLFNTITNGARSMPPYDKQISVPDRWAIVAYVRALQKSQNETNAPMPPAPPAKP